MAKTTEYQGAPGNLPAESGSGVSRRALLMTGISLASGLTCGATPSWSEERAKEPYNGSLAVPLYKELPDNIPLIVGFKRGIFAANGLNLELANFSAPSDVVRAVVSSTRIGAASSVAGIVAQEQGFPNLRIIGTLMASTAIDFLVRPDSGIKSPQDLKGKVVGVNVPTSLVTYFARSMLKAVGLEPDRDVTLVNVKGAGPGATALENHVVDCTWSSPPLSSRLELEGRGRVISSSSDAFPGMQQSVFYSTTDFIAANENVVERFLDSVNKAQAFVRNEPDEAAKIYAEFLDINGDVAKATVRRLAPSFRLDLSPEGVAMNISAAKTLGLLKSERRFEDFADASIAKKVLARGI